MSAQRLLWTDVDEAEMQAGWQPLADIPSDSKVTAGNVLDALAARHDEGGWNGRPGRWVFLREVQAATGSYSDVQRFDAVALGLVPSNDYARIVYEVKVSRADWLRELKPKISARDSYGRMPLRRSLDADGREELERFGYTIEERAKWASAMEIATEFWYAAPVRCILPSELPQGAGLLEVRPWGREREMRARVLVPAKKLDTPHPGPEFWASAMRCLAARRSAA